MNVKERAVTSTNRLKREYLKILKDPVPYISAHPLPDNILVWHFIIRGPENTPFENGVYHGQLKFPTGYPFKPPSIFMVTPSGRFKCNTRLCLSMTDYHPNTWNPTWSVSTILTGLLSFMLEKNSTFGSIETPDCKKKELAKQSWSFNLNDKTFCELFPDVVEELKIKLKLNKNGDSLKNGVNKTEYDNSLKFEDDYGLFGSAITNLIVVVIFIAFTYTVMYVISTINSSDISKL